VGSDLDLVVILEAIKEPFWRRSAKWDVTELPVPADLVVYSLEEWCSLDEKNRFFRMLIEETVWIYIRESEPLGSSA